MINLAIRYKKYLVGALLTIAMVLSFNWYVSRKEQAAYNNGFETANRSWVKKSGEYVDLINMYFDKNKDLNSSLDKEIELRKIAEGNTDKVVIKKQIEYVQTPESKNACLDDKFIHVYNESLGGK